MGKQVIIFLIITNNALQIQFYVIGCLLCIAGVVFITRINSPGRIVIMHFKYINTHLLIQYDKLMIN